MIPLGSGIETFRDPADPKLRARLLAEAADKPIRRLIQYDCFLNIGDGDDVMRPNKDGDCVMSLATLELRRSGGDMIRVHVPPNVNRREAARALRAIARWAQKDERLGKPPIPELGKPAWTAIWRSRFSVLAKALLILRQKAKKARQLARRKHPDDEPF